MNHGDAVRMAIYSTFECMACGFLVRTGNLTTASSNVACGSPASAATIFLRYAAAC
jgi:hypothetical protein